MAVSFCVNTVSNKVVRYLLAYLTVQKLLVVDVHFYVKNADFQSIFASLIASQP